MDLEDSVLLNELTRRVNEAISKGAPRTRPNVSVENMLALIEDTSFLPVQMRQQIKREVSDVLKARRHNESVVRQEISARWRAAFRLLDRCVAFADYLHFQLTEVVFYRVTFDFLQRKSARPREEAVTGALLKCLLLLSLHARACIVASEISFLTKNGFVDGAESRLRTLHEHLVVLTLIGVDQTYEVAERYQDYAAVARLKEVRALLDAWQSEAEEEWRDEEKELAAMVQGAAARWGPDIKDQYGWARPFFPGKKRISFVDLEKAAGADFLRSDYLRGNEYVHAGAYATISHADFSDESVNYTRLRSQDNRIGFIGARTATMINLASREAATGICWTAEEYDQFMMYFPMDAIASEAARRFNHSEEDS